MPPKLAEGEGKRHPLSLRTTKQLRDKLEQSAAETGRSLAQEIEIRLEASFQKADIVSQVYGLENAELMKALLLVHSWMIGDDRRTNTIYYQTLVATILGYANTTLDQLKPPTQDGRWLFFTILGLVRATGVTLDEAIRRAKRAFPSNFDDPTIEEAVRAQYEHMLGTQEGEKLGAAIPGLRPRRPRSK